MNKRPTYDVNSFSREKEIVEATKGEGKALFKRAFGLGCHLAKHHVFVYTSVKVKDAVDDSDKSRR